jgi:hypothetical protein
MAIKYWTSAEMLTNKLTLRARMILRFECLLPEEILGCLPLTYADRLDSKMHMRLTRESAFVRLCVPAI